MENNFDDIFEQLKETPESILTDLTPEVTNSIDSMIDHTKAGEQYKVKVTERDNNAPITDKANLASLVGGDVALNVFDIALPFVTVLIVEKILNKSIDTKSLLLEPDEREILRPVIDNLLRYINLDFSNPVHAFIITAGTIYGIKIFTALNTAENGNNGAKKTVYKKNNEIGRPQDGTKAHRKNCTCVVCKQRRKKEQQNN